MAADGGRTSTTQGATRGRAREAPAREPTREPGITRIAWADGRVVYEVSVELGEDHAGKRRQLRRRRGDDGRPFASFAAARRWRRAQEVRVAAGQVGRAGDLTVDRLLDRWLALPTDRRGGATLAAYRSALANHVRPALGPKRLAWLTTARLQAHWEAALAAGAGPEVVRTAHKALSGALKHAVAQGVIPRNPAAGVVLPTADPAAGAALSLAQSARLLDGTAGDELTGALWHVLLAAGLRVGEALALRWADLDLEAGVLRVARHLTRGAGGAVLVAEGGKTRSAVRAVVLDGEVVAALRRHRARQAARRLALGEAWNDLGLAFDRGDGRPLTHGAAARALARAAKRLGLPRVTPHDLRRTSATLMQGVGADPLALGRRLGHADAATTALYVARSTAGQREPAEALAAAIKEAREAGAV